MNTTHQSGHDTLTLNWELMVPHTDSDKLAVITQGKYEPFMCVSGRKLTSREKAGLKQELHVP